MLGDGAIKFLFPSDRKAEQLDLPGAPLPKHTDLSGVQVMRVVGNP